MNIVEAAQKRWLESGTRKGKPRRGVDVAGMGSDSTVFADRYGDYVDHLRVIAYRSKDTIHAETSGFLLNDRDNVEYTIIDTIGEGAGVFSNCRADGYSNALSFKASYGAKGLTDKTEARKFQ